MKIKALIQFYLPYVLPRMADWDGKSIGLSFTNTNFSVIVRPRNSDEELFPHLIDKTLSGMELMGESLALPGAKFSSKVRDRSLDRIETTVEAEIEKLNAESIEEKFVDHGIEACNVFLSHCRVLTHTPFIHGVERNYRKEDRRFYVLWPRTIAWFNGESGSSLPFYPAENPKVNETAIIGAIRSPETGAISFRSILNYLRCCWWTP